jgi:membrane protease YdiL (CAAX protease family)
MAVVQQIGVIFFLAASLVVWTIIWQRWLRGRPAVDYEPRLAVLWGPLEILLAVCIYVLVAQAVFAVSGDPVSAPETASAGQSSVERPPVTASEGRHVLLQQLVIGLATLLLILVFLTVVRRATWSDLGWQRGHFAKDLRLGFCGFLAAAPPTFLLQAVLTRWFPYRHLVTDTLGAEPELETLLLAAAMVVFMAPLVEEFLFRVLLQGWCERLDEQWRARSPSLWTAAPRHWPIVVSSAMFGLLHIGQGPAPVPLFVLALAMGYLYRQTHRQMPSLVLHGCFNATNIVLIAVSRGA